jgi:O-antigen/teichoic acid export membrane protein
MSSAPVSAAAHVRSRLSRDISEPLLRSAYSLALNVALTSALGFGFWIAAARLFPSSAVGRDSALVAAMITFSTVCQLNLSAGILRFLPIVKLDPRRVVLLAYGMTAILTTLAGTVFVVVAPAVSHNYLFLRQDPEIAVVFVAAAAAWGVFALQDAVLTALRRAPWVPLENAAFGALKILALPLLLLLGWRHAVFVAWVIPMVALLVPVNYLIFRWVLVDHSPRHGERSPLERFGSRGLMRFLAQDYLASVFAQAASTLLPILIVAFIGARQNAYFYIPFMIVSSFDLVFLNVTSSLTVEGALASSRLASLMRTAVGRFRYVLLGGVAVLIIGAEAVLLPFGAQYVHGGTTVLRLLACASTFRVIVALFVVICRIEGTASRILGVQAFTFTAVIGFAFVLGKKGGIDGVAAGWLLANGLAGCAVAPRVWRVLRQRNPRVESLAIDRNRSN